MLWGTHHNLSLYALWLYPDSMSGGKQGCTGPFLLQETWADSRLMHQKYGPLVGRNGCLILSTYIFLAVSATNMHALEPRPQDTFLLHSTDLGLSFSPQLPKPNPSQHHRDPGQSQKGSHTHFRITSITSLSSSSHLHPFLHKEKAEGCSFLFMPRET